MEDMPLRDSSSSTTALFLILRPLRKLDDCHSPQSPSCASSLSTTASCPFFAAHESGV